MSTDSFFQWVNKVDSEVDYFFVLLTLEALLLCTIHIQNGSKSAPL